MRSTTTSHSLPRRPRRLRADATSPRDVGGPARPDAELPWSAQRILAESERVFRRLQQLEARPWWRVSRRELDELDARLDVLRAHAAEAAQG